MTNDVLFILAQCVEFEGKIYKSVKRYGNLSCSDCVMRAGFCREHCIHFDNRGPWRLVENASEQNDPRKDS